MFKVIVRTSGMCHLAREVGDGRALLACGRRATVTEAPMSALVQCRRCWAFNVKNPRSALFALGLSIEDYEQVHEPVLFFP